ncbi:MAG: NUDIX domain-containing protein [Dysgonamonadaceae bacterium]|jgi:mutator protein MutT|nr:NUDIX domain-containing protein [Dysgonamonadaceae bacterium]
MHPLSLFKFCPACGSPHFSENNSKSKKCAECGFIYYFNSAAAVAAFITDEQDRLLVAVRAKDPVKGTLDLPGGFVDMTETAEQAIVREINEETGLTVAEPKYIFSLPNDYQYGGFAYQTLDIFFRCKINSNEVVNAEDDVADLFFVEKKDLKPELFGLNSIKRAINIWLTNNY